MLRMISIALSVIVVATAACQADTLYFDTNTRQVLYQSANPTLIGTSTTNISTAAISPGITYGPLSRWNGSTVVPMTDAQIAAVSRAIIRREIWHLRLVRAQAVADSTVTTFELNVIDREIEFNQRRVAAIQAGR